MNRKVKELGQKRAKLREYASEDGTKAVTQMNTAIWDIDTSVRAIQSMAIQLKAGAKNVKTISTIAFKNGVDEMKGKEKKLYEASIKVLLATLKTANENAGFIRDKLDTLSKILIKIQSTMGSVASRLRQSAKGKSKEFRDYASSMRAKAYGGCAACVAFPAACIPCYATAAGVLETHLAKYKKAVEGFVKEFNSWAGTFDVLSKMSGQAASVSKKWYGKIVDFKNIIQSDLNYISGVADVLYISQDLRTDVDKHLTKLIAKCDDVIKDTSG